MATTRLIAMHQNKGKTIAQCLLDRTDYAKNPDKTNEGELITSYECDHRTVQGEFMLSKRRYDEITGKVQRQNVISYQIRQSFKPGEVTAEIANKIGYELAMSFTKGNHAFIVATHIDKAHIHNHIIFNSTTLDCEKKFRNFYNSGKALANISDIICLKYGLSIIENPKKTKDKKDKFSRVSYNFDENKPQSHRDNLKKIIDEVLATKPTSFEDFLRLMQTFGYEFKKGKHLSFKNKEQKKFIRLRSLGEEYSEEFITSLINSKDIKVAPPTKNIDLLINIQAKIDEGKGKGFEHWAKIYNAKQTAKSINFLREHNLNSYEELEAKASNATATFNELNTSIKDDEKRLAEIKSLQTNIRNYRKTKEVYLEYRKSGYSKKFYSEHESELIIHKAAKTAFNEIGTKKSPTLKELEKEFIDVLTRKKKNYAHYKEAKKDMQDLLIVKQNVDKILNADLESTIKKENIHTQSH